MVLWADSNLKEFIVGSQARPSSPQAREFSFDNLQLREIFLTELRKIHIHQNLPQRIYRLGTEIELLGINDELVRKKTQSTVT